MQVCSYVQVFLHVGANLINVFSCIELCVKYVQIEECWSMIYEYKA